MKKKAPFSLFFKLALREVKHGWAQFLAIVSIGAIALTLFVGLEANAASLSKRVDRTYEEGNMADIWVTSSRYEERDEKLVRSLLKEGESYERRFEMSASIGSHSVLTAVSDALPTISKPFDFEMGTSSERSFCIIDEAISTKSGALDVYGFYSIGDSLSVNYDLSSFSSLFKMASDTFGFGAYFEEGQNPFLETKWSLPFEVSGVMKFSENILKASYGTSTVLISSDAFLSSLRSVFEGRFKLTLLEKEREDALRNITEIFSELGYLLHGEEGFQVAPNQYLLKIPDISRVDSLSEAIKERSKGVSFSILSVNTRENMPFFLTIESEIAQAEGFTYLFPFVFFFVAVLVILVTTSRMILRERSQIGVLKALGVTRNGIILFYVGLVCSLVFMGILVGEILGPIIIPMIMSNKYSLIYTLPSLEYVFPVVEGLLSAFGFLFVSALTSFLLVYKEASLKPSESMRPSLPSFKARKSRQDKDGRASALSLSAKMAFRNMRVNLVKSIMVVVGVMGCTALLLTGFGIEDTVNYGIDHDLRNVGSSDFTLTFNEGKKETEFADDISKIDGIKGYELYQTVTAKAVSPSDSSTNTTIYILSYGEDTHFSFAKGLKENEVAVSTKVQETLGLKEGDFVSFYLGNVKHTCPVGFFYEAFFYSGIALYSSNPTLETSSLSYNAVYLDLLSPNDVENVRAALKENLPYLLSAQSQTDWRNKINNVLSGVLVMTGAVKVFAILLALVVLYNLALLNFNERSRDIATLKVLGFNLKEIILSLLLETMFLTFFGVAFGLMLGYPFLLAVMGLNKVELVTYLYHIAPLSYMMSFFVSFVVAFLVNLYFGFRSRSIKMVESLKSVE